MKLNLTVPNNHRVTTLLQTWQDNVGAKEIGEISAIADRLGFGRLTVGEHFAIPQSHVAASGAHYLHATTALAYLAGHTERIRVAANVSLVPLQNPVVQAKQWATLDWLSGGRADLIVGVGWLKEEFDILGVDFGARGRIVDEYVEAMREIWSRDVASYEGRFVRFAGVAAEPKPLQPGGVPLWFAGDVPATLRRVAMWGVGWSPYLTPLEKIGEGIDRIRSDPAYRGQPIEVFYNLANLRLSQGHVGKDHDHDFDTWNVQQLVDQICGVRSVGVTEVAPPLPKLRSYQHYLERLHWLAGEVMPRIG
ncbi:TIGR03619 family F420-dependent LLM class oxidoreductase [Nonomuraea sp. NPDC005650]|uniref:TIGR03619 family F420-dependent LLM class oxidoreductase n=1 Tax=Nonomuraea sp. NPDC005650 TaxID=3157045 RepID=UPI00339EEB25